MALLNDGEPDPKPAARVRDPGLMKILHRQARECALCLSTWDRLSLHHVHKHPRDDVKSNLVVLCGDGVRGCHGRIEAHNKEDLILLGQHIVFERADILDYLKMKLGDEQAREWLLQNLHTSSP